MGVSIYCYAEVRSEGAWRFAGRMVPNPEREYDREAPDLMPEEVFESNCKELAAILVGGNVIRSSEPYTPVVPLRGLPTDLSKELAAWLAWQANECPNNWFTFREAIEFEWENRIMRRRAMVDPKAAHLFAGCPRGFPFAAWPADLKISVAGWSRDGIEVEWLESYAEIVPEFVRDVLPRLAGLGSPDHVRIVVVAYW